MSAPRLARVALNVGDLGAATRFYVEALGFEAAGAEQDDPALAALLDVQRVRSRRLRLGDQEIELCQADPPGAPYPADVGAADVRFQHCALATPGIAASWARLRAFAPTLISHGGPVALPAASGGSTALKFRDPDGHPLELIQLPGRAHPGVDHSALVVADTALSEAFYAALGFRAAHRQVNRGLEQDRLDGLDGAVAQVVSLVSEAPLRLELLGYSHPRPAPRLPPPLSALAATRLVFESGVGGLPTVRHDPDGHALQLPASASISKPAR